MNANPIRQELLEKVLDWFVGKDDKLICNYMGKHQHDKNANELWLYFQTVIAWVKATFTVCRKEMKEIEWGSLYNQYGSKTYAPEELEKEICALIDDDEITNHKGIYYYLFDRKQSHLNLREFYEKMKRKAYEKQGGKTTMENLQMLCRVCNNTKSDK